MISFKKIKLTPEKSKKPDTDPNYVPVLLTTIRYEEGRESVMDTVEIETWDQPDPVLWTSLQALTQDVNDICELGLALGSEHEVLRVLSISLSHTDFGDAVTISAIRKLSIGMPMVINTPHLVYAGGESPLGAETRVRINNLIVQATRFLKGHRAQMTLFGEAV